MTDISRPTGEDAAGREHDRDELTPAESLALIGSQERATRRALRIDDRLLYGTWGVAWLIAYATTYVVFPHVSDPADAAGPVWLVAAVWPICMGAAIVVTVRHIHARRVGVVGDGGRLYGVMYALATSAAGVTGGVLPRIVKIEDVALDSIAPSICIVLVIGTIYVITGALWNDRLQLGMGVWLVAVNLLSLINGPDTYTLGMAIGGGGGFLVAAAIAARRDRSAEPAPAR
jgi:hypothetical protein